MELLEVPTQVSARASTSYPASEYSDNHYTVSQLGERSELGEEQIEDYPAIRQLSPPLSPPLSPKNGSDNFRQSRKEWNERKKQKRKEQLEKARRVVLSSSDGTECKSKTCTVTCRLRSKANK